MLETVKQAIQDLPNKSFPAFYQQYVMDVQDTLLTKETESISHAVKYVEQLNCIDAKISEIQKEVTAC